MKRLRELAWLQIGAEALAIVTSILLAFAIDAWWQERSEDRRAAAIVASLHANFSSSQEHIGKWLAGNRRILAAATGLLERVQAVAPDTEIEVPPELIVGVIGAPTYSPTDSALEAAFATGEIELIESGRLLELLGVWRQQLDDTSEDELLLRQIVVQQLVPELGTQVRLGPAFDFARLTGWFVTNRPVDLPSPVRLRATTRLEAILAERVFYTTFVVEGLAQMQQTQAEILTLLENYPRQH
jgi:hypothetical protein